MIRNTGVWVLIQSDTSTKCGTEFSKRNWWLSMLQATVAATLLLIVLATSNSAWAQSASDLASPTAQQADQSSKLSQTERARIAKVLIPILDLVLNTENPAAKVDPAITLGQTALTIKLGNTGSVDVSGLGGQGTLRFTSLNPFTAVVDRLTGVITSKRLGRTRIEVFRLSAEGFRNSDILSFVVTVEERDVQPTLTVAVDPLVLEVAQSATNAGTGGAGTGAFSYVSADAGIASVDPITGLVTANASGTTTITVSRAGDLTFLDATPITYTVQVNRSAQPPLTVPQDPLSLEIGADAPNIASGGDGGGAFRYESANPGIATVDETDGVVFGVAEGTTTITVFRAGDATFADAVPITFQVIVERNVQAPLTAILDPLPVEVGLPSLNMISGGSGDGVLNFVSADTNIATVDTISGAVTGVTPGFTTITVFKSGDDVFLDATPITFTVQVNKQAQAPLLAAADPFIIDALQTGTNSISGGSGTGALSFVSDNPGHATVDANSGLITGVVASSTFITVSKAGDATFLDATPITFAVQVNSIAQAPLTVPLDPLFLDTSLSSATFSNAPSGGDGNGAFSFVSSDPGVATIDSLTGLIEPIAEGTTTITVSKDGDEVFFNAIPLDYTVLVSKGVQAAITVSNDPLIVDKDQSAPNPGIGGSGTGLFSYATDNSAIASIDANTGVVTGVRAGSTFVTVSKAGDATFLDASPITYAVTINQIAQTPLTVTLDPLVIDVFESALNSVSGGDGVGAASYVSGDENIATVNASTGLVTGVTGGISAITVSKAGDSDFFAADPISYAVQVNKILQSPITVPLDPFEIDIFESASNLAAGGDGTGQFTYTSTNPSRATVDINTGLVTGVAAGSAQIAIQRVGDDEYLGANITYTVNVNKLDQDPLTTMATFVPLEIGESFTNDSFGGSGQGAFSYTSADTNIATVDFNTGNITGIAVGSTIVTVERAGDAVFLDATPIAFTVDVTKAAQTPLVFSFNPFEPPVIVMLGDTKTTTATGGRGTKSITYSSADSLIATVDANTGEVTPVAVGSTTITASRLGDATFEDATPITYPLTVVEMTCVWDVSNWDECVWFELPPFNEQ